MVYIFCERRKKELNRKCKVSKFSAFRAIQVGKLGLFCILLASGIEGGESISLHKHTELKS
jgi:hypothetical protein